MVINSQDEAMMEGRQNHGFVTGYKKIKKGRP